MKLSRVFKALNRAHSMHFLLAYQHLEEDDTRRKEAEAKVTAVLAPYTYTEPLPNICVIKVEDQASYEEIEGAITQIWLTDGYQVPFIMTPLTSGGSYLGLLAKHFWDELNTIANGSPEKTAA